MPSKGGMQDFSCVVGRQWCTLSCCSQTSLNGFLTWASVGVDEQGGIGASAAADQVGPSASVKKRRVSVEVVDPELKLPAGHRGEEWLAILGRRITATNRWVYCRDAPGVGGDGDEHANSS